MNRKMGFGVAFTILGLLVGIFTWFLVEVIHAYQSFDVEYTDLTSERLTFEKYEMDDDQYHIYFKEYDEIFEVSGITQKALDKEALSELKTDTKVNVYYRENAYDENTYILCEMRINAVEILTLSDYKKVNRENQTIGFVACSIMNLLCIISIGILAYIAWKSRGRIEVTKDEKHPDLGEIRIEYQTEGNVIRVFNSSSVCSLVINDNIVAQYHGLVAFPFVLKGEVEVDGKMILVEAKMGLAYMRLYYDGELVEKDFMALG